MCIYEIRKGFGAVEVELASADTKGKRISEQEGETERVDSHIGEYRAVVESTIKLSVGFRYEAGDDGEGDGSD